jgi:four helix bundle protein
MAAIERFEDIVAWQSARKLVKEVYQASTRGGFARDFASRDQIRRAAVSIMSNIADGFERSGDREFRHFLFTAKASAGEVRSLLYVACDLEYLGLPLYRSLDEQATRCGKQIAGFIKYLDRSPRRTVRDRAITYDL